MWRARNLHYKLALFSSVFIAISAITGLLWAYAPYLYWHAGYMEKVAGNRALSIQEALLAPADIAERLSAAKQPLSSALTSLTLRDEAGIPVYEVRTASKEDRRLIHAESGDILSPLNQTLAVQFARQYVADGTAVSEATLVSPWTHRKGAIHDSAWIIRFSDSQQSEVVLDAISGQIIEHSDRIRRFHFWVMKLHQFNFFGTYKVLSAVSGVPLLILLISGLVLGWKRLRVSRRPSPRP